MRRGAGLETRLRVQHRTYAEQRRAWVRCAHPEAKIVGRDMVFVADGPPDFFGCLNGGKLVSFDAKETRIDRWPFGSLSDHQARDLGFVQSMGGHAFLVIRYVKHDRIGLVWWKDLRDRWWSWRQLDQKPASLRHDDELIHPLTGTDWLEAL